LLSIVKVLACTLLNGAEVFADTLLNGAAKQANAQTVVDYDKVIKGILPGADTPVPIRA
jgi:hypothetical protein